jgi:hypothetical protein
MMRFARVRRALVGMLGVAFVVSLAFSGCGGSQEGKTAQVSPEYMKKTEDMLNRMKSENVAKHQAKNQAKKR